MRYTEHPRIIPCVGEEMLGIVALPEVPAEIGVVLVVGGPQTRVGSHRQFVLLARKLAEAGYAVLRFDYRGMGDSSGAQRAFDAVDEDIAAALDALQAAVPAVRRIVLWGLCDAASAVLLYWQGTRDLRIAGFCLVNPWVRSATTLARTQVKHYYGQRIINAEFWLKLVRGQVGVVKAVGGLLRSLRLSAVTPVAADSELSFQGRMLQALKECPAPMLLILSGQDFVAREFIETTLADPAWSGVLAKPSITKHELADADHTFSTAQWRSKVEKATIHWLDQAVR
jgi:uncharacterized protein